MTTINKLSSVDDISSADQFPIYSATNGDARKASVNVLATYIAEILQPQLEQILTDMLLDLPTTPPMTPGILWLNGGVVCVSLPLSG